VGNSNEPEAPQLFWASRSYSCFGLLPGWEILGFGIREFNGLDLGLMDGSRSASGAPHSPVRNLDACWTDLAAEDASTVYAAMRKLVAVPDQALPFLQHICVPFHPRQEKPFQN
jgi:hypothetical protein